MSALQTLLVTVGVFLLACGMARPQAQPATSSAHARVEWQARKVTILSTRTGVGTAGDTAWVGHRRRLCRRARKPCPAGSYSSDSPRCETGSLSSDIGRGTR